MSPSRSTLAAVAAGGLLSLGIGATALLSGSGALAAGSATLAAASAPSASPSTPRPDDQGRGLGPGRGFRGGMNGMGGMRGMGGMGRGGFAGSVLGGAVLHGEIVVQKAGGSGTETLLVQSGTITAKGSGTVTVKSTDGFTVIWTVSADTRIPARRGTSPGTPGTTSKPPKPPKGSLADLAVGAQVQAVGTKTTSGAAARAILSRPTLTNVPERPDASAPAAKAAFAA